MSIRPEACRVIARGSVEIGDRLLAAVKKSLGPRWQVMTAFDVHTIFEDLMVVRVYLVIDLGIPADLIAEPRSNRIS